MNDENPFRKGEWRDGNFYPYKSQADMGSTEAEQAARQRQVTSRQLGVDEMAMKSERQLREMLENLQQEYQMLAAPIIKALVDIEAMKPPPPIIIEAAAKTGKAM
ncbi:hypothetical protein [Massilia sp. CT11-137]|uniref:hypothetical protein n=1 Tax=Massilia sp. CT11-137 TaxID=3393901 RepID=UPI0039AFADC0